MIIGLTIIVLFIGFVSLFMRLPRFGNLPAGERLKRIQNSPNYKNGSFQNQNNTPSLTEGATFFSILREQFTDKTADKRPPLVLKTIKTDLHSLNPADNLLIWMGHSSYFLQIDGKRILVDPVLSGHASPFSFSVKAFEGADIYKSKDIPEIDYLFISHDHWDHLDYKVMKTLKGQISTVITGLGTGAHLERWGFDPATIIEKDWNESIALQDGFEVHTQPARHFSGRGFKRNKALWLSFVLKTPSFNLYLGGDSGYDVHFTEIGQQFGPFDLSILENGQYDKNWKYIHMTPEELLLAAKDLQSKRVMPVHNSKFKLGKHPWNEPIKRVLQQNIVEQQQLVTPKIGEPVRLDDINQTFKNWWD